MTSKTWTTSEIKKLEAAYAKKPAWMTDYELAGRLASQFKRSSEAVRWQMKVLRKNVLSVSPAVKILLLDIETLPINANVWGTWRQDIQPQQIKKDWSIVCWSAKWLFDEKVYGKHVTPQEAINRTEDSVLESIWNLIDEAHVVIAHNGNEFDLKRLNTKFLVAGYPRPQYYKAIDTLKVLKENFDFTYNRMDWVNKVLGINMKMETSYKWWDEAADGNKKYLDMMLEYNMHDVNILEELYLKLRPWMTGHPNLGVFSVHQNETVCPACGSLDLHWNNWYSTPLGLYKAFRCQDCGAIGRATKKQYKVGTTVAQN